MGKPYAAELAELATTYAWAQAEDISELCKILGPTASSPLTVVGSGGSMSAAVLAAGIHQHCTGQVAKAVTPLEFSGGASRLAHSASLFLSAGGRNLDILHAFKDAVRHELPRLGVVCSTPGSPLAHLARSSEAARVHEFAIPAGKDGFLATNSLLAFLVLLYRAFSDLFGLDALPHTYDELIGGKSALEATVTKVVEAIGRRETLVVLHGASTRAAAADLESKMTEAALGRVLVADYRNFAHGRHVWLAKRPAESGVLAIVSDEDVRLAERTLSLLPGEVPSARLTVPYIGFCACIAAVVANFHFVGAVGRLRGIDPGRPGVPEFGRQLYHLRVPTTRSPAADMAEVAIERKLKASLLPVRTEFARAAWRRHYESYVQRLTAARLAGAVFDYDGTLCSIADRYRNPSELKDALMRLLSAGVPVGIATGRGKSVRSSLREVLPSSLWSRVVVGYYNAGEIGLLADDFCPAPSTDAGPELAPVADALRANERIQALCQCEFRRWQISVNAVGPISEGYLWSLVNEAVQDAGRGQVEVISSSHSVDAIPVSSSKLSVVTALRERLGVGPIAPILCIGDRGRWPGNDHLLLRQPYSLSVDEVSDDPASGWNLAPAGCRGTRATLYYLENATIDAGTLWLALPGRARRRA